jgi:hypothetical protein
MNKPELIESKKAHPSLISEHCFFEITVLFLP